MTKDMNMKGLTHPAFLFSLAVILIAAGGLMYVSYSLGYSAGVADNVKAYAPPVTVEPFEVELDDEGSEEVTDGEMMSAVTGGGYTVFYPEGWDFVQNALDDTTSTQTDNITISSPNGSEWRLIVTDSESAAEFNPDPVENVEDDIVATCDVDGLITSVADVYSSCELVNHLSLIHI